MVIIKCFTAENLWTHRKSSHFNLLLQKTPFCLINPPTHFRLKDNLEEKEEKLNKLYESPYYYAGYREGRGRYQKSL